MSHPPSVLIVGAGALGLVAAYTLQEYGGCDVTLIVKIGFEKACQNGYSFNSVQFGKFSGWKPRYLRESVHDTFHEYDYVIVSVKNLPDGPEPVEDIIRPVIERSPHSAVILFQNGLDIEKPLIEQFPGHVILSGVSLINCTNIDFVVNQMNEDSIQLGLFENPTIKDLAAAREQLGQFVRLYSIEGKNTVSLDDNVRLSRWKKLVYNASINTTTALVQMDVTRATIAGFKESLCRPIIEEIYAIAKADGYTIPPEMEDQMLNLSNGLYYKPSMCVDVDLGRMIEVETIVGNPLKLAKKYGVDAPRLDTIYHLLKMVQLRTMEKEGLIVLDQKNGVAKKNFAA
ncbi:DEKNAAC101905 [Brettanomyces naardenensis]|uniref:2-dehydropantoate 2-reductase n=1 Tax=Brettanomyces naardenensis TaxID=13370 RepID=A0A448YJA4_BRENA|nr:DEKNAAC101905 [Brettanomyces naardenensis]